MFSMTIDSIYDITMVRKCTCCNSGFWRSLYASDCFRCLCCYLELQLHLRTYLQLGRESAGHQLFSQRRWAEWKPNLARRRPVHSMGTVRHCITRNRAGSRARLTTAFGVSQTCVAVSPASCVAIGLAFAFGFRFAYAALEGTALAVATA